jgi:hypothetical protein
MSPQFAGSGVIHQGLYEAPQLKTPWKAHDLAGKEHGTPLIYKKTPTIMKSFSRHNETNS